MLVLRYATQIIFVLERFAC